MNWTMFLAEGTAPANEYSMWIALVAVMLSLVTLAQSAIKALSKKAESAAPPDRDAMVAVVVDNTRAIERLTAVIDGFLKEQGKAVDDIRVQQLKLAEVIQGIDYRTKEILKHLERSA
jgi:hypothetical protein